VATVVRGDFEWDESKATANVRKHGVTFDEALTVFEDVDLLINVDPQTRRGLLRWASRPRPECSSSSI
jgi:uncharacterized DUF497 family protein